MTRRVDPREAARLAERERTRARIEARIEKLIAQLDEMDGDADAEPSLGSVGHGGTFWAQGTAPDECEDVSEDEGANPMEDGDESDREPSLGWPEHLNQSQAGRCDASGGLDVELVNEDGGDLYRQWWEKTHA